MANIIYHIPWKIKEGRKSATGVRPLEMLQAFRDLGHDVDVVMGDSSERLRSINSIKNNISEGYKYDLIYSESSVAPTFIASGWRDYLKFGSIDFKFLKFCRKKGIPLSLFYRDMYWRFPRHTDDSGFIKRIIMQAGYRLDLGWYKKWVNVFNLPSLIMEKYLGNYNFKTVQLPPGGKKSHGLEIIEPLKLPLKLFYVGGVTRGYKLHKLFSVVSEMDDVKLRFCTREKEWESIKQEYTLGDNIEVIHKSGKELEEEYKDCDIALLYFESDEYRSFSMPLKMFEYISFLKPIIATSDTAAGNWVKDHSAGWVIPYDEEQLRNLLEDFKQNPSRIEEVGEKLIEVKNNNLWTSRAKQVLDDLTKI